MKYIGIMMDTEMSFFEQIQKTTDKIVAEVFANFQLMIYIGGSLSNRHRLLVSAV